MSGDDNDWRGQASWRKSARQKAKAGKKFRDALCAWVVCMGHQVADAEPETAALLHALEDLADVVDP
jgi:hypothetical protein